jgi:hypothetical protein
MIHFVWHNAAAQSKAGLEQYYYYTDNKTVSVNPRVWYQSGAGWYAEGRYNYEAAQSLSLIAGRTYSFGSAVSCSVTPMAGIVAGKLNGVVLASNTSAEYRKFLFYMQSQYTFSTDEKENNFIYHWADLSYEATHFLSAGVSLQHTNLYNTVARSEIGFFIKTAFKNWELPVYIFNAAGKNRYLVIGVNIALQQKIKTVAQPAQNKRAADILFLKQHGCQL